ncbi:hypothetical protein K435DRAFT_961581 [Dendrothele bispora CBS 962.96]|uniref:Uncharacterized protein n=1 Tax=Dendrothele bispora (strain CBS 962.96) TaxID=1314807 RepID=A0A4S8MQH4_DENBC|nr:hypothetical protein K435DRAFT_961581 [Dendrothele bispora CBS 962.96]
MADSQDLIKVGLAAAQYPASHVARLLQSEREAGIINHHDSTLTVAFISSVQSMRYYMPVSGATFGVLALVAIRGRGFSFPQRIFAITSAVTVGHLLPATTASLKFRSYANSLDDPQGVVQALKHVNEKARLPMGDESDFSVDSQFAEIPAASSPSSDTSSQVQPRTQGSTTAEIQKSPSKWDEIRALNSNKAPVSSWDALRQKHERAQIPASTGTPPPPQPDRDVDRAQAQAEFDAMVEKERNMK